jgi:hypothetical protein
LALLLLQLVRAVFGRESIGVQAQNTPAFWFIAEDFAGRGARRGLGDRNRQGRLCEARSYCITDHRATGDIIKPCTASYQALYFVADHCYIANGSLKMGETHQDIEERWLINK